MENHGVLMGQRPTDFVAGAFTFITWENRNPSGDWRPYLPVGEKQYSILDRFTVVDSMGCVSFSGVTTIEIQERFLTGLESNYSDRWIAKMSGTTKYGNYLYVVGDTIRNLGLVQESDYPAPQPSYTFEKYYEDIQEPLFSQLKAKGNEWKQKWNLATEFITPTKEELMKHIKHAPIQIVVPGHAIVNFLCEDDIADYFDTYEPYQKTTPYGNIQTAYKYVLTKKTMEKAKHVIINDGGKLYVVVLQGFCVGGAAAKSMEALGQLKQALEVPVDAPIFNYPQ